MLSIRYHTRFIVVAAIAGALFAQLFTPAGPVAFADQLPSSNPIADFFKQAQEFEAALREFEHAASAADRATAYKTMLRSLEELTKEPAYLSLKNPRTSLTKLQLEMDFKCLTARDLNFTTADAEKLYEEVTGASAEGRAYAREAAEEAAKLEEGLALHQAGITENEVRMAEARLQEIKVGAAELEAYAREAQTVEENMQNLLTQCPAELPAPLCVEECSLIDAAKAKEAVAKATEGLQAARTDAGIAEQAYIKALASRKGGAIAKATIARNAAIARVKTARDALDAANTAQSACANLAKSAGEKAVANLALTEAEREAGEGVLARLFSRGLRTGKVVIKVVKPFVKVGLHFFSIYVWAQTAHDAGAYAIEIYDKASYVDDLEGGITTARQGTDLDVKRMELLWKRFEAVAEWDVQHCSGTPDPEGLTGKQLLAQIMTFWYDILYHDAEHYAFAKALDLKTRTLVEDIIPENIAVDESDRRIAIESLNNPPLEGAARALQQNTDLWGFLTRNDLSGTAKRYQAAYAAAQKNPPSCKQLPACSKPPGGGAYTVCFQAGVPVNFETSDRQLITIRCNKGTLEEPSFTDPSGWAAVGQSTLRGSQASVRCEQETPECLKAVRDGAVSGVSECGWSVCTTEMPPAPSGAVIGGPAAPLAPGAAGGEEPAGGGAPPANIGATINASAATTDKILDIAAGIAAPKTLKAVRSGAIAIVPEIDAENQALCFAAFGADIHPESFSVSAGGTFDRIVGGIKSLIGAEETPPNTFERDSGVCVSLDETMRGKALRIRLGLTRV